MIRERVCKILILRVLLFVSVCAFAQTPNDSAASPAPLVPAAKTDPSIDQNVTPGPDGGARFKAYLKRLVSIDAFYEVIPIAGFDQVRNFPHEWRRTGVGLRDRVASAYGQYFLDQTIQLGFSTFHKEDPRYVRLGQGNFFKRTGHALKGAVVASNFNGGHTLAINQIAGTYGSWAIASQTWEPRSEQAFSRVMLWGSVGMSVKAGTNFLHEFWPDTRRAFIGH
jgi:hypothetical protein